MMKNKRLLILLPITIALTSCGLLDIFNKISDLTYKSLDEFFTKNNYTESKTVDEFNKTMRNHVHQWEREIRTYSNTGDTSTVDYSPRGDQITYFDNAVQIYSKYSEKFYFFQDSQYSLLHYSFEEVDPIYVDKNLNFTFKYYSGDSRSYDLDDAHKDTLKMHVYDDGYLFVSNKLTMIYVTKDLKQFYLGVNGSNKFSGYNTSITLPDSELLSSTIEALPEKVEFNIPIPKNYDKNIYHKDYLDEDDNHFIAYDVILPYVDILDYVELIKSSGLEIYKGEHHPLFDPDGIKGGEYVFYDVEHEYKVHLQYAYPIAVIIGDNNYGVRMRIQRAKSAFSYFGISTFHFDDWNGTDKRTMEECYGVVLPFINLGRHFYIGATKRKNGEMPLTSALDMDVECYWIYDNFYKDVITETYGELLEEAGFHLYQPPTDPDARKEWRDSDDVKYYEMYIHESLDVSVKFMFDDIYGNTIKVFKTSELKSWHNMAEED